MSKYLKISVFILLFFIFYFLFFTSAQASFFERIINLFTTIKAGPTQLSYRFFLPYNTLDPIDPWPPGFGYDLPENGFIDSAAFPPLIGQKLRLRMGIMAGTGLPAGDRRFKLQFGALASGQTNCANISAWTDVGGPGSAAQWRNFDAPGIADGATVAVNKLSGATVKGSYEEQNPSPLNPVLSEGEIIEYDWSLENNISSQNGTVYCFRMANENGNVFNKYVQYPKLATMIQSASSNTQTIDKNSGGSLSLINGNSTQFTLTAPANYLSTSHSFSMYGYNSSDFLDQVGGQPSGKLGAHSFIYRMAAEHDGAASASFNQNLTLSFNYSDSEISGVAENSLKIYKHDGSSWNALSTSVNQSANIATAQINSFSSFGLFGDAATPTPTPTPSQQGGGGGGGGGGGAASTTSVTIKGWAYPNSVVHLVRDGLFVGKTTTDSLGAFEIADSGLAGGGYNYGLWALDKLGLSSIIHSFFINTIANSNNALFGIFLPPTITADKTYVKTGETVRISGSSVLDSIVIVEMKSDPKTFITRSRTDGQYTQNIPTRGVPKGTHTVRSKTKIISGEETGFSSAFSLNVGITPPPAPKQQISRGPLRGDMNGDGKINIIDFSILAFWYKRTGFPARFDLNGDKKIDLQDFSIMAFYWTG